ncbi:MAG: DUF465 domain-containing protein [Alphaproteobacteria bacterium]
MNNEALVERLERLRDEHEVLDQRIGEMNSEGVFNDVHILRLKKQKLAIKDQMGQLENNLVPNLIA